MNYLPLPNELLRKIIQYIHPIFEYEKYIKSLYSYTSSSEKLNYFILIQDQILFGNGSISDRLDNSVEISKWASFQLEYLKKINSFIMKNPLFKRPNDSIELNEHQYRVQFDITYRESNMIRLENNIKIRRGTWHEPNSSNEINIINDINIIHIEGTLYDLLFAGLVNMIKISGLTEEFYKFMLDNYYLNTSIQRVDEIYYMKFINEYCNFAIKNNNPTYLPCKKTLIEHLMKI